ncbi:MAG: hypothetical protein AAGB24_03350 [Bacteroidota bacterium]
MKRFLVTQIENHLEWGSGASWTNKDFGELSKKIFEVTGKQLSVTTLKRVWGRAGSVGNLSVTTFDILSEFLGYENWRDFQKTHAAGKYVSVKTGTWARYSIWGSCILALMILSLLFWRGLKSPVQKNPSLKSQSSMADVSFSLDKVASGYPNTVIFRYDVGNLHYDTLFIQQSWDTRKQISLDEASGLVTSTYYLPGYFLAKLVSDNGILEERNLYIPTKGWQGTLLDGSGQPSYLKPDQLNYGETISVASEILENLNTMDEGCLYLAHLSPNPVIDGSDFQLTTSFRMSDSKEGSICQNVRMTVTGTREVISLEFSIPGCVGDLIFFMDQDMIQGKNNDFSAFGMKDAEWMQCKLVVQNSMLKVFLYDKVVFQRALKVDLGKIGGVQWYFEGLGEIRELHLLDAQQHIDFIGDQMPK